MSFFFLDHGVRYCRRERRALCARVQAATGWKRRQKAPFPPVDVPRSVRTLRELAAGGAPLNSRRGENEHFPARSPHPLAARSVGLSRAPAPSLDGAANRPSEVWKRRRSRKRSLAYAGFFLETLSTRHAT